MADSSPDLSKFVPGFDFLQGLVRNAGSAMPGVGQWIAPTLNPEEIDKRIDELRTVQFWLEQNARMLAATIQALEVQRMTLSTLRTMNVQMGDLGEAMRIRMPGDASPPAAAAPKAEPANPGTADAASGLVDPMQWWGALTKEFSQLATHALKDGAAEVTKNLPGATAMAQAAAKAMKTAMKPAAAPSASRTGTSKPAAKKAAAKRGKSAGAKTARRRPARSEGA